MNLYIDESGNTGETLSVTCKFNFVDQPYYVLAGILLNKENVDNLEKFINKQKLKHYVQGYELKAKNLYKSKPVFISEFIDYLILNKIPFFVELMDKLFYLHTQLVQYFIVPYYSVPLDNTTIYQTKYIASTLGEYLNKNIYQSFIDMIKTNTNEALEIFYEVLINHFKNINENTIESSVEQTQTDYFEMKAVDPKQALKTFLPVPDENPNKRLIHLLPNYNAFTNLIARVQKYQTDCGVKKFSIMHDEQKQFDIIFESAFDFMKKNDTDKLVENTFISEKARFNINNDTNLKFVDSKRNLCIQASDLLSGFVMRFWSDFIKGDKNKFHTYKQSIKNLTSSFANSNIGINFVVPVNNHNEFGETLKTES